MGAFATVFGAVLLVGASLGLWLALRPGQTDERWRALDNVARALDRSGFDYNFVTRGFYIHHVFLGLLGLSALLAGLHELGLFGSASMTLVAISLLAIAAIVEAVAAIVARTARPATWIPVPYRK